MASTEAFAINLGEPTLVSELLIGTRKLILNQIRPIQEKLKIPAEIWIRNYNVPLAGLFLDPYTDQSIGIDADTFF
ncbi:MAG: hypothetical protein AAF717_06740 [Bacteroidota bacterium]